MRFKAMHVLVLLLVLQAPLWAGERTNDKSGQKPIEVADILAWKSIRQCHHVQRRTVAGLSAGSR